jgi:hypothetical protein
VAIPLRPVHLEQPTKNCRVHAHSLLLYSPWCWRLRTDITILLIYDLWILLRFPNMTHPSQPVSIPLLSHCTTLPASSNASVRTVAIYYKWSVVAILNPYSVTAWYEYLTVQPIIRVWSWLVN